MARDAGDARDAALEGGDATFDRHDDASSSDSEPLDAGPLDTDAGHAGDAGDAAKDATDSGRDAGDTGNVGFTGVYVVFGTDDRLYAREVDGALVVVVHQVPYVYTGTISSDGHVDLVSPTLVRSGCEGARLVGRYSRDVAQYSLHHETCNAAGQPVSGQISGEFSEPYAAPYSGVYRVEASIVSNPRGCFDGQVEPRSFRWAVNVLRDSTVAVFVARDFVPEPSLYVGRISAAGGIDALSSVTASPGADAVGLSAVVEYLTSRDPVRVSGRRFVYFHQGRCAFEVAFFGLRQMTP